MRSRSLSVARLTLAMATMSLGLTGVACSANGNNQFGSGGAGGAGGAGAGTLSSTGTDVGSGIVLAGTGGGSNGAGGDDMNCGKNTIKATNQDLDMYVMLDQSSSMDESVNGGGSKWDAVTNALASFVNQQGLDGLSMGIQYFGVAPSQAMTGPPCPLFCTQNTDCGGTSAGVCALEPGAPFPIGQCTKGCMAIAGIDSCDPADYAKPEVEIAPLPGIGPKIVTSLGKHSPTTGTPTSAALQGAVDHAKAWSTAHPGHVTIAVLATDGEPSGCDDDLGHIDAIASGAAAGNPKILTFVIGVGSSLTALNGIASAGGTGQAFIVDTSQNTNQQFLDALNKIRNAALGCTYQIPTPTSGTFDPDLANVKYTPGGGTGTVIPHVDNVGLCPQGTDAWYYDSNSNPTQILLCPSTCTKVGADKAAEIDVVLGCKTVIN